MQEHEINAVLNSINKYRIPELTPLTLYDNSLQRTVSHPILHYVLSKYLANLFLNQAFDPNPDPKNIFKAFKLIVDPETKLELVEKGVLGYMFGGTIFASDKLPYNAIATVLCSHDYTNTKTKLLFIDNITKD